MIITLSILILIGLFNRRIRHFALRLIVKLKIKHKLRRHQKRH